MRRRGFGLAGLGACALALLLVPVLATPAAARRFQMSGTWLMRRGAGFLPFQPGGNAGGSQMTHVSMGSWTEAPFWPTATPMGGMSPLAQVVRDTGPVTATGSAPATLVIPAHRWVREHAVALGLSQLVIVQATTMLQIDAPYATASLMAGGGPGSFTWCPSNPACTAGGPVPGMGASSNGRVIYVAGANQFGGTMQMGLRGGGVSALKVQFHAAPPLWVEHRAYLGSGTALRKGAVGGGANDLPTLRTVRHARGYVTAPTMTPPVGGLITAPGPFVTTLSGNTLTMPSGVKLRQPPVTPQMTMTGAYTTEQGFPHTTGTVLVQQTWGSGGDDLFSVMGSDARTPLGAGNLNTVAGGLALRHTWWVSGTERSRTASFDKVFLTLGPLVPSLSPAGVATAGCLLLLATGYALRGRPAARSGSGPAG